MSGPASTTPDMISGQCPSGTAPDETMPQRNAHIGGNQVTGLSSSSMAGHAGRRAIGSLLAVRAMTAK